MGRKHHRGFGLGDLVELFDKDRALGLKPFHHVFIMHDGMAHIDGSAVFLQRQLHDLDGAIDACAESARRA